VSTKRRQQRIEQIRAVEREYQVLSVATQVLRAQLRADPSALDEHGLRVRDFEHAARNLAPTYLVRLFAEFETGLREAWSLYWNQTTHPKTVDLLKAIAARCRAPAEAAVRADDVRKYRNSLVHEGDDEITPIPIETARSHLCDFFRYLPLDW
jgi:hypothetical protein